jgi:hypothetical protein
MHAGTRPISRNRTRMSLRSPSCPIHGRRHDYVQPTPAKSPFIREASHYIALSPHDESTSRPIVLSSYSTWANRDNGGFLHPRGMITFNPRFPKSRDPDVDIVTVVSGGVSPQKRKQFKAQSSESDVFRTCFRTMTETCTMTRNRR